MHFHLNPSTSVDFGWFQWNAMDINFHLLISNIVEHLGLIQTVVIIRAFNVVEM